MKIVAIGNCQADLIAKMIKRAVVDDVDVETGSVQSFNNITDRDKALIETADIILGQKGEFPDPAVDAALEAAARSLTFPSSMLFFLWPHNTEPHIANRKTKAVNAGPFPKQNGNRWLNQKLAAGEDPEKVADEYINLDLSKIIPLDRMYAMNKKRIEALDAQCSVSGQWPILEQKLKTDRVYHAPLHPANMLIERSVEDLLAQLFPERAEFCPWRDSQEAFSINQPPIHPSVAKHFGLEWADENSKYCFWREGDFTHDEFIHRYVHARFDYSLANKLFRFRNGERSGELARELQGKTKSHPRAYMLFTTLAQEALSRKKGKVALGRANEALSIKPDHLDALIAKSRAYRQLGQDAEALEIAVKALNDHPHDFTTLNTTAQALVALKRYDAAMKLLERARRRRPDAPFTYMLAGDIYMAQKQPQEALLEYKHARDVHPNPAQVDTKINKAQAFMG